MKRFFSRYLLFLLSSTLLLSPGSMLSQESAPAEAPLLTHSEMEEFLATAKIVGRRTLSTGVTNSLRATLTDGRITHDAHIQTINDARSSFQTLKGQSSISVTATSSTSPPIGSTSFCASLA